MSIDNSSATARKKKKDLRYEADEKRVLFGIAETMALALRSGVLMMGMGGSIGRRRFCGDAVLIPSLGHRVARLVFNDTYRNPARKRLSLITYHHMLKELNHETRTFNKENFAEVRREGGWGGSLLLYSCSPFQVILQYCNACFLFLFHMQHFL
jgi:hypothetical protein